MKCWVARRPSMSSSRPLGYHKNVQKTLLSWAVARVCQSALSSTRGLDSPHSRRSCGHAEDQHSLGSNAYANRQERLWAPVGADRARGPDIGCCRKPLGRYDDRRFAQRSDRGTVLTHSFSLTDCVELDCCGLAGRAQRKSITNSGTWPSARPLRGLAWAGKSKTRDHASSWG